MARSLRSMVQPLAPPPTRSGPSPAHVAGRAERPLFHFGLRQMLFFVAALSALLAALVSLNGLQALALLLAALVVTFHVFSTALGSRLRRHAVDTRQDAVPPVASSPNAPPVNVAHDQSKPRPLPWYGRSGASFGWLPGLVAMSVFLGGCLGALLMTVTTGHRASVAGLVVAGISLAALSGWLAFIGGSFIGVVRGGLHEIAEHEAKKTGLRKRD